MFRLFDKNLLLSVYVYLYVSNVPTYTYLHKYNFCIIVLCSYISMFEKILPTYLYCVIQMLSRVNFYK